MILNKGAVVSWNENATVYRDYKPRPAGLAKEYLASARCRDSVLLSVDERRLEVPRRFRTIWFANGALHIVDSVSSHIQYYR
jgi:hypothetical protein